MRFRSVPDFPCGWFYFIADDHVAIAPGLSQLSAATMVIGEEEVFAKLRAARPDARPTTPITATRTTRGCVRPRCTKS